MLLQNDVLFTLLWYRVFQRGCGRVLPLPGFFLAVGVAMSNCGTFVTQAQTVFKEVSAMKLGPEGDTCNGVMKLLFFLLY